MKQEFEDSVYTSFGIRGK